MRALTVFILLGAAPGLVAEDDATRPSKSPAEPSDGTPPPVEETTITPAAPVADKEQGSKDEEPETENEERGTRNEEPETENEERGTRNEEPETEKEEPETKNQEPRTKNKGGHALHPVEDLVAAVLSRLEEAPGDAEAHYTLARVHSLALHNRARQIAARSAAYPPGLPELWEPADNEALTGEARRRRQAERDARIETISKEVSASGTARYQEALARTLEEFGIPSVDLVDGGQRAHFWQAVNRRMAAFIRQEDSNWAAIERERSELKNAAQRADQRHAALNQPPPPHEAAAAAATALAALERALEIAPDTPRYLLARARLLDRTRRFLAAAKTTPAAGAPDLPSAQGVTDAYYLAFARANLSVKRGVSAGDPSARVAGLRVALTAARAYLARIRRPGAHLGAFEKKRASYTVGEEFKLARALALPEARPSPLPIPGKD